MSRPNRGEGETLTVNGVTRTLLEWSRLTGRATSTLRGRIRCGLQGADVLADRHYGTSVEYTYGDETHTLKEWSKITGIRYKTLWYRYERQYPPHLMFHKTTHREVLKITYAGMTKSGHGWAKYLGLSESCFNHRYHHWGMERTFNSKPPRKVYYGVFTVKGKLLGAVRGNEGRITWLEIIKKVAPSIEIKCLVLKKIPKRSYREWTKERSKQPSNNGEPPATESLSESQSSQRKNKPR